MKRKQIIFSVKNYNVINFNLFTVKMAQSRCSRCKQLGHNRNQPVCPLYDSLKSDRVTKQLKEMEYLQANGHTNKLWENDCSRCGSLGHRKNMLCCPLIQSYGLSEKEQEDHEERYFDSINPRLNGSLDPVFGPPNYGFIDTPESEAHVAKLKKYWESAEGKERLKAQMEYDANHKWEDEPEIEFKSFEQSKQEYEAKQKKLDQDIKEFEALKKEGEKKLK